MATPNGYEQLLLCCAAARAGALPAPVNDQMRRRRGRARRAGQRRHPRAQVGRRRRRTRRHRRAAPSAGGGRRRALLHLGHHRKAQGRRPHPSRPWSARWPRAALWPARLHRDEAVIALPVAHIMGFAVLLGLGVAGIPTYLLPKFHPVKVLDAIESRRATMFVGVPAMYRMLEEAGASERDLTSRADLGLRCRRDAARAGGAVQADGGHGHGPAPRRGRAGRLRRGLRHGRGRRRRGGQGVTAVPRARASGRSARPSASRCRATRCAS